MTAVLGLFCGAREISDRRAGSTIPLTVVPAAARPLDGFDPRPHPDMFVIANTWVRQGFAQLSTTVDLTAPGLING